MTTVERAQIVEQLKPLLSRASNGRAKVDALSEEARLIEDIGLASLDLLELRFELENAYNATLTDEETVLLKTVGNVVDVVQAKSKGGG